VNGVDSLVNHRANNTSLLLFLEIHYCFSEDNDEKEKCLTMFVLTSRRSLDRTAFEARTDLRSEKFII